MYLISGDIIKKIAANWLMTSSLDDVGHIAKEIEGSSYIYKEEEDSILHWWLRRPFPSNFFSFDEEKAKFPIILDMEIERLEQIFKYNYYSDENKKNLLEQISKYSPRKIKSVSEMLATQPGFINNLYVPLVNGDKSRYSPNVIFGRWVSYNWAMRLFPNDNGANINKLISYFQQKYKQKIKNFVLPEMLLSQNSKGHSAELGLWITMLVDGFEDQQLPAICSSGMIDTDSGEILPIDNFELKVEASLKNGFEYFLSSKKNKIRSEKYNNDDRVIGFEHVDELKLWLLNNRLTIKSKKAVRAWLRESAEEPSDEKYNNFFKWQINERKSPVRFWKNSFKLQTRQTALDKLGSLVVKLLEFSSNIEDDFQLILFSRHIMPLSYWYEKFIEFINKTGMSENGQSYTKIINLYIEFSVEFLENSMSINLASRKLIKKIIDFSIEGLKGTEAPDLLFCNSIIRANFPLISWLFFREASELVLYITCQTELTYFEKKYLDVLIHNLKDCDSSSETFANSPIDTIMSKVIKCVNPGFKFQEGLKPILRKRLINFFLAMKNLEINQNDDFKDFYDVIRKCFKSHLEKVKKLTFCDDESSYEDIDNLIDLIMSEDDLPKNKLKITKNPHLESLFKTRQRIINFKSKESNSNKLSLKLKEQNKKYIRFLQDLLDTNKSTSKGADFPNRAVLLAQTLLTKPYQWRNPIKSYEKEYNLIPVLNLNSKCLAHWAGFWIGKNNPEFLNNSQNASIKNLPFLAGFLLGAGYEVKCKKSNCKLRALFQAPNTKLLRNIEALFPWLGLFTDKCLSCNIELIKKRQHDYSKKLFCGKDIANKQKEKIIFALCYMFLKEKEIFNFPEKTQIEEFFDYLNTQYKENPVNSPVTVRTLLPIFYLVKGDNKQGEHFLRSGKKLLNNPQFAFYYLSNFSRAKDKDKFQFNEPLFWNRDFEKQMFLTVLLGYLYINKKKEQLESNILKRVDDIPNLILGLRYLKEIPFLH